MEILLAYGPAPLIVGTAAGGVMGAIARRYQLCTLSALERHWYAADSTHLRAWILASVSAILFTQALLSTGIINLSDSIYLSSENRFVSLSIGSILFGLGMALVGTCAFGSLVRLGTGNLRSLIIIVTIAISALAIQYGPLSQLRLWLNNLPAGEASTNPITTTAQLLSAFGLPDWLSPLIALAAAALVIAWIFSDTDFRNDLSRLFAAIVFGACISFGWLATNTLANYSFDVVATESTSFVRPLGELLLDLIVSGNTYPDYAAGTVVGVVAGATLVTLGQKDGRWEACDDARELGRHLLGAMLMGIGGVLALGCTIGQGMSALSALALSAPIAIIGMAVGARIGLSILIEGSVWPFAQSR